MKILFAPDSFKGTMSSIEIIECLEKAAQRHFSPLEVVKVPIADGGEGTVEALVIAANGQLKQTQVTGPLGGTVTATYGIINNNTAVIEMAQASGLTLIQDKERNPLFTTSYGTGELIKEVLSQGIKKIIIGIGGSATNDGGIGAMQALGVNFLDKNGQQVRYGGGKLAEIRKIQVDDLYDKVKEAQITVICDVNNPLTGKNGATYVYGPQKGATPEMLETLEMGMENYALKIKEYLNQNIDTIPGAGAAGGMGAALMVFLNATLKSGIDTILDLVHFNDLLTGVDLVITGEGRLDGQSIFGKVPVGVAKRCKQQNIPVIALVGGIGDEAWKVYDFGIDTIFCTVNTDMSLEYALSHSKELLEDAAERMFRLLKVGTQLK